MPTHRPPAFFFLFILSVLSIQLSHATEKTEHVPIVLPLSVHGVSHFVGFGYGGFNLIDGGDLTVLGYAGELTGISTTLTNISFGTKWLNLDSRLFYIDSFMPLVNYSRGSQQTPRQYRPQLSSLSWELALTIRPWLPIYLRLIPGGNTTRFSTFYKEDRKEIDITSMEITNLEQTYVKTELGFQHSFSDKPAAQSYISGLVRGINQSPSSGFSGNNIVSYQIGGQLHLFLNTAVFMQYFHSDAKATGSTDILSADAVANTLNITCGQGKTFADCQGLEQGLAEYISAHNTYGTAEPLGGPERLKAYPANYFRGAHSRYLSLQLRFEELDSLAEKVVFFRFFTEVGQVADSKQQLKVSTVLSSGAEIGMHLNQNLEYTLTAARGNDGWVGHLSVARSW